MLMLSGLLNHQNQSFSTVTEWKVVISKGEQRRAAGGFELFVPAAVTLAFGVSWIRQLILRKHFLVFFFFYHGIFGTKQSLLFFFFYWFLLYF